MIQLANVTKRYGKKNVIDGITLNISEPGIYGLLGRNGAGKTTLMRLIAGHTGCSQGEVRALDHAVKTRTMPTAVSFIESNAVTFNMRVKDLIAAANDIQTYFEYPFACRMAERFGLDGGKRYKQLSFGMKNMLATILTLANTAPVVLLDEPTMGFDAVMRSQFNFLLEESYQAHPRVIIISTHLIDEIANSIGRLLVIHEGRLILNTDITGIDERAYCLTGPAEAVRPLLDGLYCINTQTPASAILVAYIYDQRIEPPRAVMLGQLSLQDFFVNLIAGIESGYNKKHNGELQHETKI